MEWFLLFSGSEKGFLKPENEASLKEGNRKSLSGTGDY